MDAAQLEQENGDLKLMFQTPGWEIFIQELWANVKLIDDVQNVSNEKDLYFKQGQLATLGIFLNFEETMLRAEAEAASESPE